MKLFSRALLALLVCTACLTAQTDPLVGTWRGTSEANQGETLQMNADGTADSNGDKLRWRKVSEGTISVSDGNQPILMQYAIRGSKLTLTILGDDYEFERVGGTPTPTPVPAPTPTPAPTPSGGGNPGNPLGGNPLGGNPLGGGGKPADPFVRKFEGENIALALTGSAGAGYRGTLTFRGKDYPCAAQRNGDTAVRGEFDVSGTAYGFEASLQGDAMQLVSGGTTYRLKATTPVPAVPANPLGGAPSNPPAGQPGAPTPQQPAPQGPAPLQGVTQERGTVWKHPRGWFSFEMPKGWSVAQQGEDIMSLNPGLTETDTLDALIMLSFGRLEADERNMPVDSMLMKNEPELIQGMGEQGIQIQRANRPVQKVSIGEVPGAIQTWRGRAQSGVNVDVWVGALVKRDSYLAVVAILVDGKGDRFLPKIKRVFQTLRPTPPNTNTQLMDALAGASFANISTTESGSLSVIYEFGNGTVRKKMLFSAVGLGGGGADTDERSSYEAIGNDLFLYFKDGQETAEAVVENGRIVGIRFGNKVYRRRG